MTEPISFSDIARLPLPGMALPTQVAFDSTERLLSYLYSPEQSLHRRLFILDLEPASAPFEPREVVLDTSTASEEAFSLEEQLRRERAREVGLGVTSVRWASAVDALALPSSGGLEVMRDAAAYPSGHSLVLVATSASGEIVGPELSPCAKLVAFVRGGDIFVVETSGHDEPRPLTTSGRDGFTNGVAEYAAQEEMQRSQAMWWSPDSSLLAYSEVDEQHIPPFRIVHLGSDETGPLAEEEHRYPFAGKKNAIVRLGVVPAEGGETVWMEKGLDDEYLARVHWTRDGRLLAELENRSQSVLRLVAFDLATGAASLLHEEVGEPYLRLHDNFFSLRSGEWLWSSERSGFCHLELRSASGELIRVLTEGDWQVDALEAVDEEGDVAYFSASKDGPTTRHLYSVPLEGGEVRPVTSGGGMHFVTVAPKRGVFVDQHSSLDCPPTVTVRSVKDGSVVAVLHDRADARVDELALEAPEAVSFETDDGTKLHGLLYRREGEGPGALVVYVYGGPHVQLAVDDWRATVSMRCQALRRHGVSVLTVDNRGSDRRGHGFESAIWHNLGQLEVDDQLRGVAWAVGEGIADPARVGIYGWSYGGYMTLRCLALHPEVFRVGVAGAPVTDWDGYDTHYTERYMGTPADEPEAYRASSVLDRAGEIEGELMIVHGLIDENVHFRHTARLVDRLVRAGKSYQLLCFPQERHLPRRQEDRAFMEEQVISFITRALGC